MSAIGEERTLAMRQHVICREPYRCTFLPVTPWAATRRAGTNFSDFQIFTFAVASNGSVCGDKLTPTKALPLTRCEAS
jgi:hypothetical protein